MTTADAEASQRELAATKYYINFTRLEELHRSPVAILAARRGPSCPSLLKPAHELNDPQELLAEIAEFCSAEQGFIRPAMPLQEIVFRVLLTRGNEHISLGDLHYELTEKWSTPIRPINISIEGLCRILDSDDFYGFDYETPKVN